MKKLRVFRSVNKMLPFLMSIFLVGLNSIANNPKNSNYLINLSSSVNSEAVNDVVPEMIIQGNTIHVVWTEDKYGVPNPLYYCRSIDLGKTWETPRLIANIKSNEYAKQPNSRKLSVDGQNVHIAFCDYDYYDGMSGRIFYFRSVNGGISFEEGKELVKCSKIYGSQIKAARGKVGIAYLGSSSKNGLRMLASTDGGSAFTENLIS